MKLLDRFGYNKLNIAQRSAIWFAFANLVNAGLNVITTPIFTRIMDSAEVGMYGIYTTWYNIFTTLITLNLAYGIYETMLVDYEEDRDNLTSSLAVLTAIFCLIGLGVFIVCNKGLSHLLSLDYIYLVIMIIDMFANLMCVFFETSNRFQFNYKKCVTFTVTLSIARTGLSLLLVLLFNDKLFGRVIGMTIPYIVAGIILFIYFISKGPKFFNVNYWKMGVKFNLLLVPHFLSSTLLTSSDRVMIEKLVNSSKAGIYTICYGCAGLITIVFGGITSVFTPYCYKSIRDKKFEDLRKNTNAIVSLTIIPALLLVLFSPEAIIIFAPKEYYEGIWMMPALVCGIYLTIIYYLFSTVEIYYKKSGYVTIATSIGAVINIILNYMLIPVFGYQVAAYTTFLGYGSMVLVHYYFYTKVTEERFYDIKTIFKTVMFLVVMSGVIMMCYPYLLVRILILLVLVLTVGKKVLKQAQTFIGLRS